MSQPRLLNRRGKIGLGVVMSVIASVVLATIGASPAYAAPDPQTVTATAAMGTKPVGIATAQVPPPPVCDLKITKTMSPTPLVSTQPATVTLTVANVGTAPCGGLLFPMTLSDNKQPGLTFTGKPVATPPAGWSCSLSSGSATCVSNFATTLLPGGTVTFTIPATVTAPPGTQVTNCAQITTLLETNTANNKSCVTKQVA